METKIMVVLAFVLYAIGVVLFTLLADNTNLIVAIGGFVIAAMGLHRVYKRDQREKDDVIVKLQLRVDTFESEAHRCKSDQIAQYNRIDDKFKVVFNKLDDLPDKVAQSVNMIRIEQDMKISDTNKRIDEILKDKRK
jgi:hypothetical protein